MTRLFEAAQQERHWNSKRDGFAQTISRKLSRGLGVAVRACARRGLRVTNRGTSWPHLQPLSTV